jgi:hypothetical protein
LVAFFALDIFLDEADFSLALAGASVVVFVLDLTGATFVWQGVLVVVNVGAV